MNAAFALARSAARLAPLTVNDPRIGAAKGTPASGNDVASAVFFTFSGVFTTGGTVVAVALALAAEAAAAAEAAEDALEELPVELLDPLDELPDEDAPLEAPLEAATAAAAAELEELLELEELVGVLVEDSVPALEDVEPLAPALTALPADAAAAAAAEEELEDELLEAAEANPAESKTANNDNNTLFIIIPNYYLANVFDQTHPFFLPDYDQYRNTAGKKSYSPWLTPRGI